MHENKEIKIIDFNKEDKKIKYLINNQEKWIQVKFETFDIVNRLNYLLDVLDGDYGLLNGVNALKKVDVEVHYTENEIELLNGLLEENRDILKSKKLVLDKLSNKRYSKDLVGNIDNDEKVEFLIDVALDEFRVKLRKALSLYKDNEVRVKKYFKMCKDINYSEINEAGETPKANIILTELLYKNLNSNFIDERMKKSNVDSNDFYIRLYTLITVYCRLNILNEFGKIDKINYEVTSKVHSNLIKLFNKKTVEKILFVAIEDKDYKYKE
ncbi:hypothetical protein [uncultured Clostridium sp.]|uniref:hypothetical protein n=1 Tax=uncultured Clostridium sp. TaxID=59620 RepID=UPI00262D155C|nr:hypothetical protein [uncultured Clostridium sp.]